MVVHGQLEISSAEMCAIAENDEHGSAYISGDLAFVV